MPRTRTHKTETATRLIFEEAVSTFSYPPLSISEGNLLFRGVDERDYGVDGELEIFNGDEITGRIARIQLKGTENEIVPLKSADFVSCPGISKSSLGYCRAEHIPFILVYISKANRKFYYCDLQPVYQDALNKIGNGKTITIRIPVSNNSDHLERLVEIINDYYEKAEDAVEHNRAFERKMVKDGNKRNEDEGNLWDYPGDITDYVIENHQTPADGEHKMVDSQGNTVKIGFWKDGELEKGTEYNHLIRVTKGSLIFKPGCPDAPYDDTDDFEYEKLEMYHWNPLTPFYSSEYYIAEVGMHNCYVVDMEVDGNMEQMVNIRPLEEFLASKNPRGLKDFKEIIDMDREEVLEAAMEINDTEHHGVSDELESVLRIRKAKLSNSNGSATEVDYSALDLLKLFMESNYGKNDFISIATALSRVAIDNKSDKDAYWKIATVRNAVPGMLDKNAVQELVNVLRAYKLIDCDKAGMLFVTDKGKEITDQAIILLDQFKGKTNEG